MTDEHTNGVRVTNAEIYKLLLEVNGRARSVQQTVEQVVLPRLDVNEKNIDRLELRLYAITSGLIAAALGANQLGLI